MTDSYPLPQIEDLLLHRGNMLLIDRVIASDNESTVAEYTPRVETWYADAEGRMPAWIGLELMAQVIASHVGLLRRREDAPPKQGVLLGTRAYRATVPFFTTATPLRITAVMVYRDASGLGAYNCSISSGDTELATAVLKVFEPENFQTFMQGNTL